MVLEKGTWADPLAREVVVLSIERRHELAAQLDTHVLLAQRRRGVQAATGQEDEQPTRSHGPDMLSEMTPP
jgi:hypothetical protein